jgi:hypothetical protein
MSALIALLLTALAAPPVDVPLGSGVSLPMRDPVAAAVTTQAVSSAAFWSSATVTDYDGEVYDQIRLRPLSEGYFTLITGEGGADFPHEVVVDTALRLQERLPAIEDGAVAIKILGEGIDSRTGLPSVDTLFLLDFSLFYGVYIQRSTRLDADGRTFVFFEKLTEAHVDAATWARYRADRDAAIAGADLRWALSRVVEIAEVFGTFIIEPGTTHTSRVSFLVRLRFGDDAGSLARLASELPPVLRQGLQSGFANCVRIAAEQTALQLR